MTTAPAGPPLLLILSGPSGAGKDAVLQRLKQEGLPLTHVTTMTTRPRRELEVEGVDYYFVTEDHFQALARADELLEHANVYGNWYGVPKAPVRRALAAEEDVIIKIDVQGAATIRRLAPEAVLIFLTPPHLGELVARLERRHTETEVDLKRRIGTAEAELLQAEKFDHVVENPGGDIDHAVARIADIIREEKARPQPRRVTL